MAAKTKTEPDAPDAPTVSADTDAHVVVVTIDGKDSELTPDEAVTLSRELRDALAHFTF